MNTFGIELLQTSCKKRQNMIPRFIVILLLTLAVVQEADAQSKFSSAFTFTNTTARAGSLANLIEGSTLEEFDIPLTPGTFLRVSGSGTILTETSSAFKTSLSLVKADVGLGSVDNTADADKPVSSAQQTALNGKQNLSAVLTILSGLTPSADKGLYFTGPGSAVLFDLSSDGRALLAGPAGYSGQIAGTFTGDISNATGLTWTQVGNKPDPVITAQGDATGSVTLTDVESGTMTLTLAPSGVSSGTYGSANVVPQIGVDAKGRVISVESSTITPGAIGAATSAQGATADSALQALTIGQTIFVDPTGGNDTTGLRGRADRPFATLAAAEAAATAAAAPNANGDVIVKLPGDYPGTFVPTKLGVEVVDLESLGSVNQYRWPNVLKRLLAANAPLKLACMGDSVANAGYFSITQALSNMLGFNGGDGGGGSIYWMNLSGSSTYDGVTWPAAFSILTSGNSPLTISKNGADITANLLKVYYVGKTGAGTFKIQTNTANAGWVDEAGYDNIDANVASSGTGMVVSISKTRAAMQARIVHLTGTTSIVGAALYDTAARGVTINDLSLSGTPMTYWGDTPDAIKGPVLASQAPTAILMQWKDSASIFETQFPLFKTFVDTYLPNTDIILVGTTPIETGDVNTLRQNRMMRNFAIKYGWAYFDGYTPMINYARGLADGFLQGGGDVHPTTNGYAFVASALYDWLAWGNNVALNSGNQPISTTSLSTTGTHTATRVSTVTLASSGATSLHGGAFSTSANGEIIATGAGAGWRANAQDGSGQYVVLRHTGSSIQIYDSVTGGNVFQIANSGGQISIYQGGVFLGRALTTSSGFKGLFLNDASTPQIMSTSDTTSGVRVTGTEQSLNVSGTKRVTATVGGGAVTGTLGISGKASAASASFSALPTGTAGLAPGDIYSDAGTLKIMP